MSNQTSPAVVFDVDGTLVDSNYLHVHAWQQAFVESGVSVETWRIHRSIGMDGSTLVRELSGHASDERQQELKKSYDAPEHELTMLRQVLDCTTLTDE